MKTLILLFSLSFGAGPVPADSIALQQLYDWAEGHYPTVANIEIREQVAELNMKMAQSLAYPQLSISGRAVYQSEVPEIRIPGASQISKDQYDLSLTLNQNLYNGGKTAISKEVEKLKGEQGIHEIETELQQLRSQINGLFFNILLAQKQKEQISLLMQNLKERHASVRSGVENGVLPGSRMYILEAEMLKVKQDSAGIASNMKAGYRILSELTGQDLSSNPPLKFPDVKVALQPLLLNRPEVKRMESSRKLLAKQAELTDASRYPVVSLFGSAGYGRPGYDFLNDDFHDYYRVGIQLKWSLWDYLNAGKKRNTLELQQKQVNKNMDAFQSQVNTLLLRLEEEIKTIRENMQVDRKIINLREKTVEEKASQLENGVLTSTEYVTELYHAHQARLALSTRRIELAKAKVDYRTLLGLQLNDLNTNGGY